MTDSRRPDYPPPVASPLTVRPYAASDTPSLGPSSEEAELRWLPVLGPTAFLTWRRFALGLAGAPDGFVVSAGELAKSLGVGPAALRRSMSRLGRFGLLLELDDGVAVSRRLPERAGPGPSSRPEAPTPPRQEHSLG